MESAYLKTVYFDDFETNHNINKKISDIAIATGKSFQEINTEVRRQFINNYGRAKIAYYHIGYGVPDDPLKSNYGNNTDKFYGKTSMFDYELPVNVKIEEEPNKKLLLL